MTKEELKKEAIKFAVDYPTSYGKGYKHKDLRIAYLAGAEFGYNKAKEEIRDILQRWYEQHHDKTYTETFYLRLIEDTEKLLWVDTKGE